MQQQPPSRPEVSRQNAVEDPLPIQPLPNQPQYEMNKWWHFIKDKKNSFLSFHLLKDPTHFYRRRHYYTRGPETAVVSQLIGTELRFYACPRAYNS